MFIIPPDWKVVMNRSWLASWGAEGLYGRATDHRILVLERIDQCRSMAIGDDLPALPRA